MTLNCKIECFDVIVQMARLYRDSTLQNQIDLTLTRLILESINVSLHCAGELNSSYMPLCDRDLVFTFNKTHLKHWINSANTNNQ